MGAALKRPPPQKKPKTRKQKTNNPIEKWAKDLN